MWLCVLVGVAICRVSMLKSEAFLCQNYGVAYALGDLMLGFLPWLDLSPATFEFENIWILAFWHKCYMPHFSALTLSDSCVSFSVVPTKSPPIVRICHYTHYLANGYCRTVVENYLAFLLLLCLFGRSYRSFKQVRQKELLTQPHLCWREEWVLAPTGWSFKQQDNCLTSIPSFIVASVSG